MGRGKQLRQLRQLLTVERDGADGARGVVLISGLGGVGKTRLVLHLLSSPDRPFEHFVFVDLTSTEAAGGVQAVARDIATAMGAADHGRTSTLDALIDQLPDTPMLLVLDNCENLTESVGEVVEALLEAAPALTVLATSRVPLGIDEAVLPLRPLVTNPDPGGALSEAAELYRERAQAVGASISEDDWPLVERTVSELLDGIPLAIEMAAGRLRTIPSVRQLHDRLDAEKRRNKGDNGRDLLTAPRRGSRYPARQATMRTIVAWSWNEASSDEQALWSALSVFAGSFELEAAEAVAGALGDRLGEPVLDVLDALTDLSVVTPARSAGRLELLDTLARMGRDQLRRSGLEGRVRDAHLAYYLAEAESDANSWFAAREVSIMQRWQRELPNVRLALGHAEATGQIAAGLRLLIALTRIRVVFWASVLGECRAVFARLLARPEAESLPPQLRTSALAYQTMIALLQGDQDGSRELLARTRESAATVPDDVQSQAVTEFIAATSQMIVAGDGPAAVAGFESAMRRFPDLAEVRGDLHMCILYWGMAASTAGAADLAQLAGRAVYDHAREHDAGGCATSWAVWPRSVAAICHGTPAEAAAAADDLRASLSDLHEWGDMWGPTWMLIVLAWALTASGEHAHAAEVFGGADHFQALVGCSVSSMGTLADVHQLHLKRCRDALGAAAFDEAYERGRAVRTPAEIVGVALEDRTAHAQLTRREREVADLIAHGMTSKAIAAKLVIAQRTVDTHVERILTKLRLNRRTEIAAALREQDAHTA